MEWYLQRFNDDEFERRRQHILTHGLPVRLRFPEHGNFACIYTDPMPSFVHLSNDAALAKARSEGWDYHVTIGKFSHMDAVDLMLWEALKSDYNGVEVVLEVQRITSGATAELRWTGLGADHRLWTLFLKGPAGYKYHINGHGLHVSM